MLDGIIICACVWMMDDYGCMDVGTHWSTVHHCTASIPALQSNWTPVKGNVSCLCKYLTGSGGALVLLQHPSFHNPDDEEV